MPSLATIRCSVKNTWVIRACSAKVNCTGLNGSGMLKLDLAGEKRIHALL